MLNVSVIKWKVGKHLSCFVPCDSHTHYLCNQSVMIEKLAYLGICASAIVPELQMHSYCFIQCCVFYKEELQTWSLTGLEYLLWINGG